MIAAVCAVLVAAIAAYLGLAQPGFSNASHSKQTALLSHEIARRPYWQGKPEPVPVGDLSSDSPTEALTQGGDVQAFSPGTLYQALPAVRGQAVYLVGKVVATPVAARTSVPRAEIELRGFQTGYEAYLAVPAGSPLSSARKNDMVFALGYLAAYGVATTSSGPVAQTVYVVAPRVGDAGFAVWAPAGGSIARLAAGLARLPDL
jgi:hypothetical protein